MSWGHSAIDIERLEDRTLLAVVDVVGAMGLSQFTSQILSQPNYKEWGNEPFIAVNPTDTNKMVISGFAYSTSSVSSGAALWYSTDGGANWTMTFPFQAPASGVTIPADQTFAYDSAGNLHGVFLGVGSSNSLNVYHGVTSNPANNVSATWTTSVVNAAGANGVDQPYMAISSGHVYIAYDDFTSGGLVRVARSDDNGVTFTAGNDLPITAGSIGQPGNSFTNPGVRIATDANGNAYSIVGMGTSSAGSGVQNVTWRLNSYQVGVSGASWDYTNSTATPGGILIDSGSSHQIDAGGATWFGGINELRGNTTAIAVSRAGDHIYAVWGKRDAAGLDRLYVEEFHPGGGTLIGSGAVAFSVTGQRAALPSVAVTDNGTVFIEYTSYNGPSSNPLTPGGNFQVHLVSSSDLAQTFSDQVLYSYVAPGNPGDPGFSSNRLLGDYNFLQALGDSVYGVFPARGNVNAGGINTTGLISPFFFTASAANAVTITESPNAVTENGGQSIDYTLTRSGNTANALTVTVSLGGTAVVGADYTLAGATVVGNVATVTIAAGSATAVVTMTPINDTIVEYDETVDMTIVADTGYSVGNPGVASGTITDVDTAVVTVIPIIDGAEAPLPSIGRFRAVQSFQSSTDTVVNYTMTGTATQGTDYSTLSGSVTIVAGQTFANIDIPVLNDLIVEGSETVIVTLTGLGLHDPEITLTLSNPNKTAQIIITDDDLATVSITKVFDGAETNTPINGRFRVTQSLVSTSDTVVNYSVSGTATAGSDYTPLTGTVTIPAGLTFADFDVVVLNDSLVELTETVVATLTGVVGSPQISVLQGNSGFQGPFDPTSWLFTAGPGGAVNTTLAPASIALVSGNSGVGGNTDYVHTISVSGTISFSWSYSTPDGAQYDYPQYLKNGVATLLPGYSQAGANNQSGTAVIPVTAGSTFGFRMVTTDGIAGAATTVFSNFFAPGPPAATVNITDDDTATVSIAKVVDGAEAPTPVNAQFLVTQTVASSTPTTVNYSIGGSATNGSDYTTLTGSVIIPAGQLTAPINVAVINDITVESLETVDLTLTGFGAHDTSITLSATPGALSASADITDNDSATLSIIKVTDGAETNTPTNGRFRLVLTSPSSTPTVVNYSIAGTATNGTDYGALTGTATIPAGSVTSDIIVTVINDTIIESTESVILALTGFVANDPDITFDAAPPNLTATVNITDNDTATVAIAKVIDGVETNTPVNGRFRVTQTATSSTDTVLSYSVVGTAAAGLDYVVLNGTVTIAAGTTFTDIDVTVLNDAIIEGTETVTVTLTSFLAHDPKVTLNPSAANLTATVNITDTDTGNVSIAKIADGQESTIPIDGLFRITQTAVSTTNTVINYSISGSATAGSDYVTLTGVATIPAGQTTVDINVVTLNDVIIEGIETVDVTLTSLAASDPDIILNPVLANRTATVNIVDVESVSISKILDGAEQSSPVAGKFRLTQSVISASNTEVNYSVTGTATAGGDYVTLAGMATILAGQTTVDIDVPVLDDLLVEGTESVIVTLTSLGAHDPGISLDPTPAQLVATVGIIDDDVPTFTSSSVVFTPENTPASNVVLNADVDGATIPGLTITYSLTGADAGLFTIDSATGEIRFAASPDYETPLDTGANNGYDIIVLATADVIPPQVGSQAVTINVTPVNDNTPVITSLSTIDFDENQPISTVVLDVETTDGDQPLQTFNYSLSGPDAARFAINSSTGEITFLVSPDYEAPNDQGADRTYNVTVNVTDSGVPSLSTSQAVAITILPVNDNAPLISSPSTADVPENSASGSVVLDVNASDIDQPGQTVTYSLSGPDAGLFLIDGATGEITILITPDFETPADLGADNFFNITVVAADNGTPSLTTTQLVTIHITPVNDNPPVIISLPTANFTENQPIATVALDITAIDNDRPLQSLIYSLSGPDAGLFAINSTNGQITFLASPNFEAPIDQGTNNVYDLTVTVSDSVVGGFSAQQSVTITVTNANEIPTDIALSVSTVNENQPIGTAVGNFSTTDIDVGDTFTYTLVPGTGSTDNGKFTIVGGQLRTAVGFDFETKSSYSIRVRSRDAGGLFTEKAFVITIIDINDVPTNVALSSTVVAENQSAGTVIGSFSSTDQDAGDTFNYTLVAGPGSTDNSSFTISGGQLLTAASFDYETKSSYSIRVRTTDFGGLSFDKTLTINVTNVNEQPTDIGMVKSTVPENQVAGTLVGGFTTTDFDAGDSFTYQLVTGAGSADNSAFTIVNGQLLTVATFDFETRASYSIRVRSTDVGGLSTEKALTIGITNVNEKPTSTALLGNTVAEDQPVGTPVGNFSTIDIDAGDTFNYSLVLGTGDDDNDRFAIVGNQLQTAESFDFEARSTYSVRVRTRDAGGLFIFSIFTINVTNVNDAPQDITISPTVTAENQASGTTVGTFTTTDADIGETFTYSLVGGAGSTNNSSFTVVGNQLRTAAVLDFETQTAYSVRVRSTDSGGLSTDKILTINVTNVNEQPTDIALSAATVIENQPVGTLVGNLSSTDSDFGDTFTYTLVSGIGSTDNASFAIVGGQLRTTASFDFETKSSYSVRIRSTDGTGLFTEKAFTISVTNVNEAPTNVTVTPSSVAENQAVGTTVGSLATTDQDAGDTFTYALVSGAGSTDNGSFVISGNQLKTAATFNFETKSSYSVRVRSTDLGGLSTERILLITVANVNEAPVAIGLSDSTIDENQPANALVGTLSSADPDAGDTFTYTLVSGAGDSGNAAFVIVGSSLQAAQPLDFETQASYSIRVRSTDANGLSVEQVLTIQVNDTEDPPVVELTGGSVTLPKKGGAIDPGSDVSDQDSTDFVNNRIVTTIQPANLDSADQLRLIPQGKGAERIKASKGHLKLGKTIIGTVAGGRDGEPLSITFTTTADAALVQKVLQHIGFKTKGTSADTRKIEIQMFDGAGNSNPPVVKDVTIA